MPDLPVGIVRAFSRGSSEWWPAQVLEVGDDGRRDLMVLGAAGTGRREVNVPEGAHVPGCEWYWTDPNATAVEPEAPVVVVDVPSPPTAIGIDDDDDEDDDKLPF